MLETYLCDKPVRVEGSMQREDETNEQYAQRLIRYLEADATMHKIERDFIEFLEAAHPGYKVTIYSVWKKR